MFKRRKRYQTQLAKARITLNSHLIECEDRAWDREMTSALRRLKNMINAHPPESVERCNSMLTLLDEVHQALTKGHRGMAELCVSQLQTLSDMPEIKSEKRGVRMGIFSKVKRAFSKEKETPRDKLLRDEETVASNRVFEIQKRIMELAETRQKLLDQMEEKVTKCAALSPDSYEYKIIRQQALLLRPRIASLEQQINVHAKLLENNAKYHALLEAGISTFQIRSYMPDTAQADMLMEMIAEETKEVIGDGDAFGESIHTFDSEITRATAAPAFGSDDDFDRMVSERKIVPPLQEAMAPPADADPTPDKTSSDAEDNSEAQTPKGELA